MALKPDKPNEQTGIAALIRVRGLHWFYTCTAWLRVRGQVLELDHHECVQCKQSKRYARASVVHHVKTILKRPDLALSIYDPETGQRQLISLCRACHERIHGRANRWDDERW